MIFLMPRVAQMMALSCILLILAVFSSAQSKTSTQAKSATTPSAAAEQALTVAASGHCAEAIPSLRKAIRSVTDPDLKKRAGLAGLRCSMTRNLPYEAIDFLQMLSRDFPRDPEVLYQATHAYSDLSIRASQDLTHEAPYSYQVHELSAESMEVQGKMDEAAAEYKKIIEMDPTLPGIHYRLGRIILSKPQAPTTIEDARNEFQAELKIDPNNAGAEYILGEISRQAEQWDEAILHFSRASKLDANFADAFLGLGFALNSVGRYADAIPPLEAGVKLQPENPTGHYQLAIAYNRVGRKEDAKREAMLQKQSADKLEQAKQKAADAPQ